MMTDYLKQAMQKKKKFLLSDFANFFLIDFTFLSV